MVGLIKFSNINDIFMAKIVGDFWNYIRNIGSNFINIFVTFDYAIDNPNSFDS